ncbi:MAG: choice-of-anchor L domain-containing protein, partial [Bacteroidota bacterium]
MKKCLRNVVAISMVLMASAMSVFGQISGKSVSDPRSEINTINFVNQMKTSNPITVTPLPGSTYTPTTLVQTMLVSGCLQASNVVFTGNQAALGSFATNNSGFPLGQGIVMSTGNVSTAVGPNVYGNRTTQLGTAGNADLNVIVGSNLTQDAAVLEFDFIPAGNVVEFKYIFASEEYPEWACSQYNDVFAFLLSGPGIAGNQGFSNNAKNIALLPDMVTPVTINNIHVGGWNQNTETSHNPQTCPDKNANYYQNNIGGTAIEFDGYTVVLTASWPVTPCQTYHIKLAIADVGDKKWDSGVFIEGKSFISDPISLVNYDLLGNATDNVHEGCGYNMVFSRNNLNNLSSPLTINYTLSGTASSADHTFPSGTVTIPANVTSVTVPWTVAADAISDNGESLIISLSNGCPCSQNVITKTLTLYDPFTVTSSFTNAACNGVNNGTITVQGSGGSSIFRYQLNGGTLQNQGSFTGLAPGNYTVTVYDGYSCNSQTLNFTIGSGSINLNLALTTPILCNGGNATVTASATGGTSPYTYSIDGVNYSATNIFTFAAGPHTVYVKDGAGCTTSSVITVTQNAAVGISLAVTTPVACFGGNAVVTATGSGGNGVYTYSKNGVNYASTNSFSLPAGTYTIYVKDGNGCIASSVITVGQNTQVGVTATVTTPIACYGGNATVTATGTGGSGSYTYSTNGVNYYVYNTFSLAAGTYTIYVKDGNGCTATTSVTVTQNNPVGVTLSVTAAILCNGGQATVQASGTGGNGSFTYSLDGITYSSNNQFMLSAGTYTIYVKDGNGCTGTGTINVTQNGAIALALNQTIPITCFGGNATVQANATGGTGVYTYSGDGVTYTSSNIFSLPAGTHTVYVKDNNGCISTASITITQPDELQLSVLVNDPIMCFGGETSVKTIVSGGIAPYTYFVDGIDFNTVNMFSLGSGTHTITVFDANGCSVSSTLTLTENSAVALSLTLTSPVLCSGGNATVTATATGGTGVFTYSSDGMNFGSGNVFTLGAGVHTIYVMDENSCTASASIAVYENAPVGLTVTETTPVACFGGNATLTAVSTGGDGQYSYTLDGVQQNGNVFIVAAGNHTVIVTDGNGCTATSIITINQNDPVELTLIETTSIPCHGGTATVTAYTTGGNRTYSYILDGTSQSTSTFDVTAGTHTVIVTDDNGCSDTATIVIIENPVVGLTLAETHAIACFGGTATVTATATGGNGVFTYTIDGIAATSNVFTVTAGTHT